MKYTIVITCIEVVKVDYVNILLTITYFSDMKNYKYIAY
jgi:hypothetical protein